jgi:hypothetical protein
VTPQVGGTLLFYATMLDWTDGIKALLEFGADPNATADKVYAVNIAIIAIPSHSKLE